MYRSTFSCPRHWLEVSCQLHAPAALPPRKSPRYPFYRRLGGPQSRYGRYGVMKIFYPTGIRTPAPPGRPACSQLLYRLSYPGSPFECVKSQNYPSLITYMYACDIWGSHGGNFDKQGVLCLMPNILEEAQCFSETCSIHLQGCTMLLFV
jgi:hypothetical protein